MRGRVPAKVALAALLLLTAGCGASGSAPETAEGGGGTEAPPASAPDTADRPGPTDSSNPANPGEPADAPDPGRTTVGCPGEALGAAPLFVGEGGPISSAEIGELTDVAPAPGGIVYISATKAVLCFDGSTIHRVASVEDLDLPEAEEETALIGIAVDSDGSPLAVDWQNPRVIRISEGAGEVVEGSEVPEIGGSRSLVVGPDGTIYTTGLGPSGTTFVWSIEDGRPEPLAGYGRYGAEDEGRPAEESSFYEPEGLAMEADGALLVADRNNGRVVRIGTDGILTTLWGAIHDGSEQPGIPGAAHDVAVAADGTVFVLVEAGDDGPSGILELVGTNQVEPLYAADGRCSTEVTASGDAEACSLEDFDASTVHRFDADESNDVWLIADGPTTSSLLVGFEGIVQAVLTVQIG